MELRFVEEELKRAKIKIDGEERIYEDVVQERIWKNFST